MNTAINPLVSLSGGGAPNAGQTALLGSTSFAQLIQGQQLLANTQIHPNNELATLVLKANNAVASLKALEDLDFSDLTLDDIHAFFAEGQDLGVDPHSLIETLRDIQDILRDLIDVLPDLMSQFAPEELVVEDLDVLNFAAIVEVSILVRDIISNQHLAAQQTAVVSPDAPHLQVVAATRREPQIFNGAGVRPLQSLSLVSDIDGITLPEPNVRETLTPPGATVFRTIVTAVIQSQRSSVQSIDFEASEAPLALSARADQPIFEQIDQPQAPQPAQRPENLISTKFANVLVNQVRQVDIQEGTTRIELSPRGLGSIEVEMRTNSDGSLSVVVRAENDAVLSALREERDLLAAIIGENASGSLDFQEYSQEQSNEHSGFANNSAIVGEEELAEAEVGSEAIVDGPHLDLVT